MCLILGSGKQNMTPEVKKNRWFCYNNTSM